MVPIKSLLGNTECQLNILVGVVTTQWRNPAMVPMHCNYSLLPAEDDGSFMKMWDVTILGAFQF